MGSCVSKSGVRGRDQGDLAVQPTVGNPAAVPTRKKSDDVLTELPHADLKVYIPAADGPLAKREESRCVPWHEFELFRQVAPHDMAELVDRMTIRTYEKGDLIVRKGTIGTTMYLSKNALLRMASADVACSCTVGSLRRSAVQGTYLGVASQVLLGSGSGRGAGACLPPDIAVWVRVH
jgi:hypothetical protein